MPLLSMPLELGSLIQTTRGMIDFFSKAKAAKLLRELVDSFLDMHKMGHATGREVCLVDDPLPITILLSVGCAVSGVHRLG